MIIMATIIVLVDRYGQVTLCSSSTISETEYCQVTLRSTFTISEPEYCQVTFAL